jgi:hypothetical protein
MYSNKIRNVKYISAFVVDGSEYVNSDKLTYKLSNSSDIIVWCIFLYDV